MIKIPMIFGIESYVLREDEKNLFAKFQPKGFILFSRNIQNSLQLQELCTSLKSLYLDKILILVDQEGGRVARLRPPIAEQKYPAAVEFADRYEQNPQLAIDACCLNYYKLAQDLARYKIDSPCAPVCDLLLPNAHDIIGDRSFGSEVEKVIDLSSAAILGILDAGLLPIIKHIPGHGRALVDSHYSLPHVDCTIQELVQNDFAIFKSLAENLDFGKNLWAMTAHIIYSAIDAQQPATLSKKVIEYIKEEIGFAGVIITDDICMYALHGELGQKVQLVRKLKKASDNYLLSYTKEDAEFSAVDIQKFKDYFALDITNISPNDLPETIELLAKTIEPMFVQSLLQVTETAIEAGCEIILHCSGLLAEMKAICQVFDKKNPGIFA